MTKITPADLYQVFAHSNEAWYWFKKHNLNSPANASDVLAATDTSIMYRATIRAVVLKEVQRTWQILRSFVAFASEDTKAHWRSLSFNEKVTVMSSERNQARTLMKAGIGISDRLVAKRYYLDRSIFRQD